MRVLAAGMSGVVPASAFRYDSTMPTVRWDHTTPQEWEPLRAGLDTYVGHYRQPAGYHVWREHGTFDWLLTYTLRGEGRFGTPDGDVQTGRGQLVLLAPGTRHDYGTLPTARLWEFIWVHFVPRPDWKDLFDWPELLPGVLGLSLKSPPQRRDIEPILRKMLRYWSAAAAQRDRLVLNCIEELLLLTQPYNPRSRSARFDPRIRQATDYLHEHLGEKLQLAAVADVVGLSVYRFAHLFRQQVGLTPRQYLEQERMRRARHLLQRTEQPIKEIATVLGFESPFHFSSRFKKLTGESPQAFRQRMRRTPLTHD